MDNEQLWINIKKKLKRKYKLLKKTTNPDLKLSQGYEILAKECGFRNLHEMQKVVTRHGINDDRVCKIIEEPMFKASEIPRD